MANTINPLNPRLTDFDCFWGPVGSAFSFGLVNQVKPNLKLLLEPITRGTTGKKLVIGHFVVGLEPSGTISVAVPDVAATTILAASPWMTPTTNQVLLPDTPNTDLYSYAKTLTLHPHDLPLATTTEDLTLVKAVPMNTFNMPRDGEKETDWIIEFMLYPDRAQITASTPRLLYGYLGPVPS